MQYPQRAALPGTPQRDVVYCNGIPNQEGRTALEGRKEMFYLTTHVTHLVTVIWRQTYGYGPF